MPTPIEMLRAEAVMLEDEAARLEAANSKALRKIENRARLVNEYRASAAAYREAAEALTPVTLVGGSTLLPLMPLVPDPGWGTFTHEAPVTHTGVCPQPDCGCHVTIEQGGGSAG